MSVPSYETTLNHCEVSDSELSSECPEDVLHMLAGKMTRLRSTESESDGVELENELSDSVGKRRKRWRERFGHAATYSKLCRHFIECERGDLAVAVCEEYRKKNPKICEGE